MKRILKTWILTMMFCLGSIAIFSQADAAYRVGYVGGHQYAAGFSIRHGAGYGYHDYGYRHGYGYGYRHGYGYGYQGYGYKHGYGYGYNRGCGYRTFNCKTFSYDCCSGCYYPVVTTYQTCVVPCRAYSCDNCCPCWYTYYKRYTYAIKTVKYHTPYRYNNCNSCCY